MTFVDGSTVINADKMNGIVSKINELITAVNGGSTPVQQTVATPSISITNGVVNITCATSGATIYYTTNGGNPTTSSTVFTTEFTPPAGTTYIKAIAIKSGMTTSSVASQSYVSPYTDITNKLAQGYIGEAGIFENTENANVILSVFAKEDSNHLLANSQQVEYFVPNGFTYRPWGITGNSTLITEATGSGGKTGTIAGATFLIGTNKSVKSAEGVWISAEEIYEALGNDASAATYPIIGINIKHSPSLTPQEAISAGVVVRRRNS